jgi:hypothetical protein
MLRFRGTVQFRSTATGGGSVASAPPGEAEILELNPQRGQAILAVTGWGTIEPGTVNLRVEESVIAMLTGYAPAWVEEGDTIRYPASSGHIPLRRVRYYYYKATARSGDQAEATLIRRAHVPPYRGLLELFAATSLKKRFGLQAGDGLIVEVQQSD